MMKIYISIFFLFLGHTLFGQLEYSLQMQSHLPQSAVNVNPGIFTDHKVYLALPSVYGSVMNGGFSLSDALTRSGKGRRLNMEKAIRKMDNTGNQFRSTLSGSMAAITFQLKKAHQMTFFHNTQLDFQAVYPKALPELLWRGNGAFIGQRVEVAPILNFIGYNEYGVGFATHANEKTIVGFNLKYVNGFMGIRTEKSSIALTTDEEYYQLTFENDILINTAGFTDIFDENEDDYLADTDPAYLGYAGNQGFSVDLGLTYKVNKNLELQFAVQDFGYITWETYNLQQTSNGTFTYDGQIVRPFGDGEDDFDFEEVRDSLGDIFEFTAESKPFLSNFPIRGFAAGTYKLEKNLEVGASLHAEHIADAGVTNMALALHAQKLFGRVFYLGGVLGFHNEEFAFLGANATLQLGPVQLYFMTDNLMTLLDPTFGRYTNLRTGMNFSFGRKNRKKKDENIEGETVQPDAAQPPNYFN